MEEQDLNNQYKKLLKKIQKRGSSFRKNNLNKKSWYKKAVQKGFIKPRFSYEKKYYKKQSPKPFKNRTTQEKKNQIRLMTVFINREDSSVRNLNKRKKLIRQYVNKIGSSSSPKGLKAADRKRLKNTKEIKKLNPSEPKRLPRPKETDELDTLIDEIYDEYGDIIDALVQEGIIPSNEVRKRVIELANAGLSYDEIKRIIVDWLLDQYRVLQERRNNIRQTMRRFRKKK